MHQSVLVFVSRALIYARQGNHFSFFMLQPLFRNGTATVSSPLLEQQSNTSSKLQVINQK
jgi:hypothetical protein